MAASLPVSPRQPLQHPPPQTVAHVVLSQKSEPRWRPAARPPGPQAVAGLQHWPAGGTARPAGGSGRRWPCRGAASATAPAPACLTAGCAPAEVSGHTAWSSHKRPPTVLSHVFVFGEYGWVWSRMLRSSVEQPKVCLQNAVQTATRRRCLCIEPSCMHVLDVWCSTHRPP